MKPLTTCAVIRVALPVIKDKGLDSRVSPHFGKSPGFIVVDSDGNNCEYLDTKSARLSHECAPIRALVKKGCRALLCRSIGKGALTRSHEAGLLIYQATGGKLVADVINAYQLGECPDLPDSSICNHHHDH